VIYLLEYDRQSGALLRLDIFTSAERGKASKARLELEIDLLQAGISHEVVLLEAESEEALRKTHNRYFRDVSDLAKSVRLSVKLSDPAKDS
jgi:hypothetical protein